MVLSEWVNMTGKGSKPYIEPTGLVPVGAASDALPLAGGRLAFTAARLWVRENAAARVASVVPVAELRRWCAARHDDGDPRPGAVLDRLGEARPPFAGLDIANPRLMGIVNVTPDSFSDGGDQPDAAAAIAHGERLLAEGADIVDVGGESTRPGARPVSEVEERRRVLPVVEGLAAKGATVSIDTRRAGVMRAALAVGARVVNDVTALTGDADSLAAVAESGAPVVLMHMAGEPGTMQDDPTYDDAVLDIYDALEARIAACVAAGIARARIAIDPGIGFGKSVRHNAELIARLTLFHGLGCALVLGASRKSFIARLSRDEPPKARLAGSLAAALAGLERGAQFLRVHDVGESRQALSVWRALRDAC